MRAQLAIALVLAAASPALACNSELLRVTNWQASPNEGNRFIPVDLEAEVEYLGERSFRMVHGGVIFQDALGRSIGQVNLDRDQHAGPGDTFAVTGHVDADERLLTINRDDVRLRACVWSMVYENGEVEKFD